MTHTLEWAAIDGALRLIRDKRKWTRYAVTRRPNGVRCRPEDDRAIRYCAFGALARAANELVGDDYHHLVTSAERHVLRANGYPPQARLASVNDRLGHAAVVKALEQALKSR